MRFLKFVLPFAIVACASGNDATTSAGGGGASGSHQAHSASSSTGSGPTCDTNACMVSCMNMSLCGVCEGSACVCMTAVECSVSSTTGHHVASSGSFGTSGSSGSFGSTGFGTSTGFPITTGFASTGTSTGFGGGFSSTGFGGFSNSGSTTNGNFPTGIGGGPPISGGVGGAPLGAGGN